MDVDLVVVGAGLAGLSAAREATARGASVTVLEARDRVGGRTLNHPIGDGKIVELGGQWVGPTQERALALIEELGLETFKTHGEGRNLFESAAGVRGYRGTIPRVNPVALAEVGLLLRRIDRMASQVDPEHPWAAPEAEEWDRQTFATWMRGAIRTGTAREMMRLAVEAVWAAEPEDLSLLHLLFYVRSAGSIERLLDTEGGAQDSRVVGGTQLISLRMAEQLGDRVRLSSPVHAIEHGPEGVTASGSWGSVAARRAVLAMPPTLAGRLDYRPALPAARDAITQRMAQGNVVKCMAVYDRPFWRDRRLSGQATSTVGPVSVTYDNSPPDGRPGVLLAFLEGNAARRACDLSEAERRSVVLGSLRRLFGREASDPAAYVDKAWAADEWARGCYGGFLPPGAWTEHGRALRAPIGPLHWAGAETASVWSGYMDGAISSGARAAAAALARL